MASSLGKPVRWNLLGDKHRARSLVYEAKRLLYILPSLQQELKQYGIFRRFHNGAYVRIKEVFGQLIVDMFYPTMGEVLRVSDVEAVHELYVLKEGLWVDKYVPIADGLKKVWKDKKLKHERNSISVDDRYIYAGPDMYSKTDCEFLGSADSVFAVDRHCDLVSGGSDEDNGFYLTRNGVCQTPRWVIAKVEKNHKHPRLIWSKTSAIVNEKISSGVMSVKADRDGVFIYGSEYYYPSNTYESIRVEKRNLDTGELEWVYSSNNGPRPNDDYILWHTCNDNMAVGKDYIYISHPFDTGNPYEGYILGLLILDKTTGAAMTSKVYPGDYFHYPVVLSDTKDNIYLHGECHFSTFYYATRKMGKGGDGIVWESRSPGESDPLYINQMALLGRQVVSVSRVWANPPGEGSWWGHYLESRDISSGVLLYNSGLCKGRVRSLAAYNKTKVIK